MHVLTEKENYRISLDDSNNVMGMFTDEPKGPKQFQVVTKYFSEPRAMSSFS